MELKGSAVFGGIAIRETPNTKQVNKCQPMETCIHKEGKLISPSTFPLTIQHETINEKNGNENKVQQIRKDD